MNGRVETKLGLIKPDLTWLPGDALETVAAVMQLAPRITPGRAKDDWLHDPYRLWSGDMGAIHRHLNQWWRAMNAEGGRDRETGLSHLAHAAARILMLMELEAKGRGLDDRRPVPSANCGGSITLGLLEGRTVTFRGGRAILHEEVHP